MLFNAEYIDANGLDPDGKLPAELRGQPNVWFSSNIAWNRSSDQVYSSWSADAIFVDAAAKCVRKYNGETFDFTEDSATGDGGGGVARAWRVRAGRTVVSVCPEVTRAEAFSRPSRLRRAVAGASAAHRLLDPPLAWHLHVQTSLEMLMLRAAAIAARRSQRAALLRTKGMQDVSRWVRRGSRKVEGAAVQLGENSGLRAPQRAL